MSLKPPSRSGRHVIIGKAIADPAFRQRLVDDPEAVFAEHGEPCPSPLRDRIKSMDASALHDAVKTFTSKVKGSGGPD